MTYPDFNNSILNISATLGQFLGVDNSFNKVRELEYYLQIPHKKVVFILFDALGIFPINQNLSKDDLLRKSIKRKLTSTFPSTTATSTTTLHSMSYPSYHGYLGWCMYFKEINKVIELFSKKDEYSSDIIKSSFLDEYLKFDNFYTTSKKDVVTIAPTFAKSMKGNKRSFYYDSTKIDEFFSLLYKSLNNSEEDFIYCYCSEPDSTMHKYGVSSLQAKELICYINNKMSELKDSFNDTLFIITADHGQSDISKYIDLYLDDEITNTLAAPFFLEGRFTGILLKENMEQKFLNGMKKYENQLKLFKSKELIDLGYFGPYTKNLDRLGDYIITPLYDDTMIVFSNEHKRFKGHHTGLSEKEMMIPLIIFNS